MSHLPGKFVWFEHLSTDPTTAGRFYEQLFGWHTERVPMGDVVYPMIMNSGEAIGGYGNADAGLACWRSYLSVPDVDERCAAALAAGATVLMPPTDYGDVGRAALIQDPGGASVALWKGSGDDIADPADPASAPFGSFCWNELYVDDPVAAVAFYEKIAGYSHDEMDMGPMGTYYIVKADGVGRGGVMRQTPGQSPLWVPYVWVADTDATATLASHLGATVCVAPTDIPNIGRFTMMVDPAGAMVAALGPLPAAA